MFRALFDSNIFNIQSVVGLFTGNYHAQNKQLEQCQIYKIPSLARIKQNKNGERTKETTVHCLWSSLWFSLWIWMGQMVMTRPLMLFTRITEADQEGSRPPGAQSESGLHPTRSLFIHGSLTISQGVMVWLVAQSLKVLKFSTLDTWISEHPPSRNLHQESQAVILRLRH